MIRLDLVVGVLVGFLELILTTDKQQDEHLDFGGGIEAHCIDTLEQVGLQVEFLEGLDRVEGTVGVPALDLQIILVLHETLPDDLEKGQVYIGELLLCPSYLLEERPLCCRHILVLEVHQLLGASHSQPVHLPQRLLLGVGGPGPVHFNTRHPSVR